MIQQVTTLCYSSLEALFISLFKKGYWHLVNFSFKPVINIWNCDQCQLPKKHSLNKLRAFLFNFQLFRTNIFHVSFIARNLEITFFKTEKKIQTTKRTKIMFLTSMLTAAYPCPAKWKLRLSANRQGMAHYTSVSETATSKPPLCPLTKPNLLSFNAKKMRRLLTANKSQKSLFTIHLLLQSQSNTFKRQSALDLHSH